ncbi:hypothetical protein MCOR25_003736 [Pyricularia grisea]|uniref:Sialidase n=1 Tax=Pyricularia grisea TaxID=148305 RepID=A0A6P8B9D1_PYRGI|nr:uncharacterized protein PgNI_04975 [Pyricularia grisea]KAI6372415.1 hypothetical protein MCOR25_003736 [Pyricularia grisea]TLD12443.1 hypothetical protein PgNI_04975 [Pyricularia grisea]
MSTLVADFPFEFTFPTCEPSTPPSFSYDPSLLEIPYSTGGHARSNSQASIYSFDSSPSDSFTTDNACSTRMTTPARSPIRTHGPLLLPKIRSQDSAIGSTTAVSPPKPKRMRTSPSPAGVRKNSKARPTHARSFTNPEAISFNSASMFVQPQSINMTVPPMTTMAENMSSSQLLCSPVSFIQPRELTAEPMPTRRASSCGFDDSVSAETFNFPDYRQMSPFMAAATTTAGSMSSMQTQTLMPQSDMFYHHQQTFAPRESSPLASAAIITPDAAAPTLAVGPTSTLMSYLTTANPAPALVRTISFPLRDPHTKHFWWDVRQVRPWTAFNASNIMSLPGASTLLSTPVPASLLPSLPVNQRHPETEAALHSIYSNYYLPKLNAALALSSTRPLQLSHPSKSNIAAATTPSSSASDFMFVANVRGEASSAAAIFGGKPTARVVGLVKSYDRFNTGMRVEGNIKRVEYLRGLAHLHHVMREHGCRYGFILTEIELVFVRNGAEGTPHFGYLEVGSTQLANQGEGNGNEEETPLTACLALWGLCMLAGDEPLPGHAHWRSEIGAPAEGTRRKALPRDDWMPQPQLAEKREAKRARGWVMPEDAIGRKELGKRGVRYNSC